MSEQLVEKEWIQESIRQWENTRVTEYETSHYGIETVMPGAGENHLVHIQRQRVQGVFSHVANTALDTYDWIAQHVPAGSPSAISVVGFSAALYGRLFERGFNISGVNVAQGFPDHFVNPVVQPYLAQSRVNFRNMASFLWWLIRDELAPDSPDSLCLCPDADLVNSLIHATFTIDPDTKTISVMPSPALDNGKAVALGLALYVNPQPMWAGTSYRPDVV